MKNGVNFLDQKQEALLAAMQVSLHPLNIEDDAKLAELIRYNLKKHGLDIPGTVYFDPDLDHLSAYYTGNPGKRAYYILKDDAGKLIGGVGYGDCGLFEKSVELQKLYLDDEAKGKGLGRFLMEMIIQEAARQGFENLYLETHHNLPTAIRLYQKLGFERIERPDSVSHSTMDYFALLRTQEN